MGSLKHKTVSGFKWLVVNQFGQRVIRLISFAILARILEPTVFGLFAMAFIAIDGFSLFKSFGVDAALIQRNENAPDFERAKHTAFYLVQIMGFIIFLIFQITAPWCANLLRNQEVLSVMRALGVIFIIGNLGRIPNSMLTKHMQFRLLSVIELIASVVNSICSVIFALIWPNIWSLVLAYLVKQIVTAAACWYFEPYRVKLVFDKKIAKELTHFGKFMVGMSIISYIGFNIDNVLVSRYLGATILGFYVLAENITSFTHQQVVQHIGRVLFPAIAAIQDDPAIIKRAYLKTVRYVSIVAIPFTIGMIAVAKDFTLAMYGEKWMPIVPMIQLLALMQIIDPVLSCAGSVFMGCNKPKYSYNIQLGRFIVKVPVLFFMIKHFGVYGVIYTNFVLQAIFAPINLYLVHRLAEFSFWDFLKQLVAPTVCSLCMLASIFAARAFMQAHPELIFSFHHIAPLVYFAIIGIPTYVLSFYFVDRAAVKEVFRMLFKLERA